jgi:hypothetical protein
MTRKRRNRPLITRYEIDKLPSLLKMVSRRKAAALLNLRLLIGL